MKGIIFTSGSVRGIRRGVKSQTRRLVRDDAPSRYRVGDVLYVKEGWDYVGGDEYLYQQELGAVLYRDDDIAGAPRKWRTPLFMPEWAARLNVTVTDVRTERLLAITAVDARAEGVECSDAEIQSEELCRCARLAACSSEAPQATYLAIWDTIHRSPHQAEFNPLVYAYTFTATPRSS